MDLHSQLKSILATLARTGESGIARDQIEALGESEEAVALEEGNNWKDGGSWNDSYWAAIRICELVDSPAEGWESELRDLAGTVAISEGAFERLFGLIGSAGTEWSPDPTPRSAGQIVLEFRSRDGKWVRVADQSDRSVAFYRADYRATDPFAPAPVEAQ